MISSATGRMASCSTPHDGAVVGDGVPGNISLKVSENISDAVLGHAFLSEDISNVATYLITKWGHFIS